MALTLTDIVTAVRRAIGDRTTIGNETSMNSAVVDATNRVVRRLSAKHDWDVNMRQFSATITTADYIFSLPSTTNDATMDSVKSILNSWLEIDNQGYRLDYISTRRKNKLFTHTDPDGTTGQPIFYGRFDESNFWVDPFPDQTYTVHMRVSVYPVVSTINSTHPLGTTLDEVIVSGVCAEIFRELQEPDDAFAWERHFLRLLDEQMEAEKDADYSPSDRPSYHVGIGVKPGNFLGNPWYKRSL